MRHPAVEVNSYSVVPGVTVTRFAPKGREAPEAGIAIAPGIIEGAKDLGPLATELARLGVAAYVFNQPRFAPWHVPTVQESSEARSSRVAGVINHLGDRHERVGVAAHSRGGADTIDAVYRMGARQPESVTFMGSASLEQVDYLTMCARGIVQGANISRLASHPWQVVGATGRAVAHAAWNPIQLAGEGFDAVRNRCKELSELMSGEYPMVANLLHFEDDELVYASGVTAATCNLPFKNVLTLAGSKHLAPIHEPRRVAEALVAQNFTYEEEASAAGLYVPTQQQVFAEHYQTA